MRLILLILIIFPLAYQLSTKRKSQFKITILDIKPCSNPTPPYEKERSHLLFVKWQKTDTDTIISGNIRVLTETEYFKLTLALTNNFSDEATTWQYKVDVDCKSYIFKVIHNMMGLPTKLENYCRLPKGYYKLRRNSVERLDSAFGVIPVRTLGMARGMISVNNENGTVFCLIIDLKYEKNSR